MGLTLQPPRDMTPDTTPGARSGWRLTIRTVGSATPSMRRFHVLYAEEFADIPTSAGLPPIDLTIILALLELAGC